MVVYDMLFFQLSTVIRKNCDDEYPSDESDYMWTVTSLSGLSSVSGHLHADEPDILVVDIPGDVSTAALTHFFQVIQKEFCTSLKLKLRKSYLEYDQVDKSLLDVFPDFK